MLMVTYTTIAIKIKNRAVSMAVNAENKTSQKAVYTAKQKSIDLYRYFNNAEH